MSNSQRLKKAGLSIEPCGSHFHVAFEQASGEPLWSRELATIEEARALAAKTLEEVEAGSPPAPVSEAEEAILSALHAMLADAIIIPIDLNPNKDPKTLN